MMPKAYSRVIMSLEAIVAGPFFNEYIKKGMSPVLSNTRHYWQSMSPNPT
jgi:hypothetical protein